MDGRFQPIPRAYCRYVQFAVTFPTMKDRAMQKLHLLALEPVSETTADGSSFGFRPERSTADAMAQCFIMLAKGQSPQWVLEGDIKGCFDNINHQWLIDNIPTDKAVLQKWLKAGYVYQGELFPTEAGTPQGGIISPTLANMVLDGLESKLIAQFGQKVTRKGKRNQVNLARYADDFVITGKSKELLENEVKPLVIEFLKERGLTLSAEKTKITHIDEGFDFLGWNMRKYDGKLLIKPSKRNVKAFLDDIRETVKDNKALNQKLLIRLLNPKIKGWANYHKNVVASETFHRVDHEIWKILWQWAKRRHPKKSITWVKEKYFKHIGTREWVFSEVIENKEGKTRIMTLVKAQDTKIQRHVKIKGDANPFDPKQESYFEERLGVKMVGNQTGKTKWLRLWWRQDKECPICHEKITEETGWNIHHIIPKSEGGGDNISNLTMLHPNCHRQHHAKS